MSPKYHKPDEYSHQAPYPEIRVKEKNLHYAEILMDDFAGMTSELTAINQYLYHHFLSEDIEEEIGELLEGVAITEMHHMDMLADLILKLGGYPTFRGSYSTGPTFWNGSFVYYGQNIHDQLLADINAEIIAINTYRHHMHIIDDPYVKEIIARIILDEELHLKLFNEALAKLNR